MNKFKLKNELACFVFYGPITIIYTLLSVVSTVMLFVYSFTDFNGIIKNFSFVGFSNYVQMLHDDRFYLSLINSLKFFILIPILTIPLALLLAGVINNMKAFKNIVKMGFFFPTVLAGVAVSFMWVYMFRTDIGVINGFFRLVGLGSIAPDWLGDLRIVILTIAIVAVWQGIGTPMMLLIAALQTVPKDIIEASEIDGASSIVKFFKIVLPIIKPTLNVCILITVTGAVKIFAPVLVMTDGGPGLETNTLVYYIRALASTNKAGYGSAVGVALFIITGIIAIVQFKLTSRGEAEL